MTTTKAAKRLVETSWQVGEEDNDRHTWRQVSNWLYGAYAYARNMGKIADEQFLLAKSEAAYENVRRATVEHRSASAAPEKVGS